MYLAFYNNNNNYNDNNNNRKMSADKWIAIKHMTWNKGSQLCIKLEVLGVPGQHLNQ